MALSLRTAVVDDADAMEALRLHSLQDVPADPDGVTRLRGYLTLPTNHGVLAHDEGTLVGWAMTRFVDEADAPPGWYLLGVVVHPDWRRRGVARALTDERLAWLTPRAERVFSFTAPENHAAMAMHAAHGFTEVRRDFTMRGRTGMVLFERTLR
ncbi:MAG: GNAT family N-acetyltransferase [Myxococcota bacterium]